ncbi:DEHA2C02112p [Debaryomyces hansenii CBS767]|uniref:DEHA2C02112p n=1 Tax=Debaryomyces hansenii (strain ATCC 36239 / CBS 767 / BCRC 21394 / JCM 1990 / NBRC 0083 / IGC 2968) TaxID=284592 RepID=Q6BVJ7_DEBHA|nr:DEHA2C02112p [Debaryomyces hansenii CBS767]CAG85808.2 DEHA2C02112p [Debaryomyces hansenii CBS767]|eukprot:XP_457772.2 DEHA2C02112p [Debaryomyces hansenii CBS767]
MSMNPEALQKLLIEMDNQLNVSRAELSMCNLQLDRVNTNLNLIQSTNKSLNKVCNTKNNEAVWQGIGKAFVKNDVNSYLKEMAQDEKEFNESKENLSKKKNYLETTLDKTLENMTQIVGNVKK